MEVTRLSERQALIVSALRTQQGQWMKRSAVAEALGRKRLNQLDLEALAALEARGLIEVERVPDLRTSGFVAQYRVSGE